MNIEVLKEFLLWCLAFNYLLLLVWFMVFWLWHDGLYHLHRRWFLVEKNLFDAMHYRLMGTYKIGIFLFNLIPFLAVCRLK